MLNRNKSQGYKRIEILIYDPIHLLEMGKNQGIGSAKFDWRIEIFCERLTF